MSDYDNTNTGAMFANDKKGNEKRPDRRGSLNVEGTEFWISGWLRKKKDTGEAYMSIKVERKDQGQGQPAQRSQGQQQRSGGQPAGNEEEDDIPF